MGRSALLLLDRGGGENPDEQRRCDGMALLALAPGARVGAAGAGATAPSPIALSWPISIATTRTA